MWADQPISLSIFMALFWSSIWHLTMQEFCLSQETSSPLENESCIFLVTLQTWCCLGCLGSHCFIWSKKVPELNDYSWIHKDKFKATKKANNLNSALVYIPVSVYFVTKSIKLCVIKITKWWPPHCNFHKTRNRKQWKEFRTFRLNATSIS